MKKIQKPRRSREAAPPAALQPLARKFISGVWSRHGRLLLLWVFILAAYSNSFRGAFVYDNKAILQDPRIRAVTAQNVGAIMTQWYWYIAPASGLYRPVTTFSYLLNYAVFHSGVNPPGYHWFNFVLHVVNVTLVYALGIVVFADPPLALAFAGIWGLHPLLTESVTNIVGRADLLAAFGVLAGLLCYVRWASATGRRKHWWLAAMVAAQTIGLFSKESAAVLPGILLLYDLTWSKLASWRARVPAYAVLALPFFAFLCLRSQLHAPTVVKFAEGSLISAGFWTARLTAIKVVGKYLWLFLWPARLSPDYSYNAVPLFGWKLSAWADIQAIVALGVCVGAIALAIRWRRTWKPMFFFIMFFAVALAPTANLVLIIGSIMAERFLYLPSIGLAGCLVGAIYALGRRLSSSWSASPRAAWIAIGVACLALAVRTHVRNSDWHDDLSLWSSAVRAVPGDARAHLNLGNALARIPGRLPDAVAEFRTAVRISPDDANKHYYLARALAKMPGGAPAAVAEFQAALRSQPNSAEAHYNLGNTLARMPGRLPDAIAEYQAALHSQPAFAQAHNNLANVLAQTPGRQSEAIQEWRAALRIQPNLEEARANLDKALAQLNDQQQPEPLPGAASLRRRE